MLGHEPVVNPLPVPGASEQLRAVPRRRRRQRARGSGRVQARHSKAEVEVPPKKSWGPPAGRAFVKALTWKALRRTQWPPQHGNDKVCFRSAGFLIALDCDCVRLFFVLCARTVIKLTTYRCSHAQDIKPEGWAGSCNGMVNCFRSFHNLQRA